uniref:Uncharacterized protein n=1 Tax=Rhizophora mucronata TaxID=61149 RepID=A0A2P2NKJ9_RHIMU
MGNLGLLTSKNPLIFSEVGIYFTVTGVSKLA